MFNFENCMIEGEVMINEKQKGNRKNFKRK